MALVQINQQRRNIFNYLYLTTQKLFLGYDSPKQVKEKVIQILNWYVQLQCQKIFNKNLDFQIKMTPQTVQEFFEIVPMNDYTRKVFFIINNAQQDIMQDNTNGLDQRGKKVYKRYM